MPLTRERIFEAWASSASPWSVWAKPVLFACLPNVLSPDTTSPATPSPRDTARWLPSADSATLLVVDLPGALSIQLAEVLIDAGFRPVPLFNAVPGPASDPTDAFPARSVVNVESIINALQATSARVLDLLERLPVDAPPAFLLDADRRLGYARPGDFDNRSVSLPTDFPSASFLRARSISQVLLVTYAPSPLNADDPPDTDLAHTLLRWQTAGLQLRRCSMAPDLRASEPHSIQITRPSRFGVFWHNALSLLGLRRHPFGGFGGKLPLPSSG